MNKEQGKNTRTSAGLRERVLLAALEFTGGDLRKSFTAEDLLMKAWARDPLAWGLRGYELQHPDSKKIRVEIDRANVKGGMVGLGFFEKIRQRTYRLTPSGLVAASRVTEADPSTRAMAERKLADAVKDIISHPVFVSWTKDSGTPKYFRDAGHFWGIAPGTPPRVIGARVREIDQPSQTRLPCLMKGEEKRWRSGTVKCSMIGLTLSALKSFIRCSSNGSLMICQR